MRIWLYPPNGSDLWGFINLGTGKTQRIQTEEGGPGGRGEAMGTNESGGMGRNQDEGQMWECVRGASSVGLSTDP